MKILDLLKSDDQRFGKNLWLFLGAYFLVLFNYPLVRASSTTFFFEAFGAKSTPAAWLWAVLFLTVAITICNKLQSIFTVQKVFLIASLFSALIFSGSLLGTSKFMPYGGFIWKDIYIVIQVHLLLAYANSIFSREEFKVLIGPIGAVGSLGGVLGGLLTSYLSSQSGTLLVMIVGIVFVFAPALFFFGTPALLKLEEMRQKQGSPLASLNTPDLKRYVIYIALIVGLTQFIINIADFRFNLVFEQSYTDSTLRTIMLGHVYTWTNLVTLIFQFLVLPFLLPRISEKNLHLFIPLSYLACVGGLIIGQGVGFIAISALYIYFKAADYSLFSAGKEMLYHPLRPEQKYGAKYLTDMLMYRASKAMIAAVLIYLQSSMILNMMMIIFLSLWVIMILKLFQLHRKIFS